MTTQQETTIIMKRKGKKIVPPSHWFLRVGNGVNFINSSTQHIWGINAITDSNNKYFINNAKKGDILWFVKNKSDGLVLAIATFEKINKRELGELINLTQTNEELGWDCDEKIDTEIIYTDLYNVKDCNILTYLKGANTARKYNPTKCTINLPVEYNNILKYHSIKKSF